MRKLVTYLRNVWRRADLEREMADELAFHIEARATDLAARHHLSREEAARRAQVEFGSVESYKEEGRASLGLRLVDDLRCDLRGARRALRSNRGFFAAAVVILAVGIGANTAVFSVVDALLLYELPVEQPAQLVAFDALHGRDSMLASYGGNSQQSPGNTTRRTSFSAVTFERFRDHATTLSHVFAAASLGSVTVLADDGADLAEAQAVSGGYFAGLGVRATLGRTLRSSDDRPDADPVAVIGDRFWQRRFNSDKNVLGKSIKVNGLALTVVGLTQAGFHGTGATETIDLSVPLEMLPRLGRKPLGRHSWWLLLMGRLKPGVTRDQSLAELTPMFRESVVESWAARPPQTRDPWRTGMPTLRVLAGAQGPNGPSLGTRRQLTLLFGVSAVVMLITCLNITTLLVVRAVRRRPELVMRRALGASRGRLIRQLLSESLVLAGVGTIAGVVVAAWGKDLLPGLLDADAVVETAINGRALLFAGVLAALTTLICGVGQAVPATRAGLMLRRRAVSAAGGTRATVARALIALQIAASLVLLIGAGLFVRTLYNYGQVHVGFDPRDLLVFQIEPGTSLGDRDRFDLFERIAGHLESVPGIRGVTMSTIPVLARSQWTDAVRPGGTADTRQVHIQIVRSNFFETMRIPLLTGRNLQASDIDGAPRVALINAAMAKYVFDEAYPVGRYVEFANRPNWDVPIQVVGVVGDAKYSRLDEAAPPTLFLSYAQMPRQRMVVEVRTSGNAVLFAAAVRDAVRTVDPTLPVMSLRTQEDQIAETIREPRMFSILTALSAGIGLLLACIGLYGVVAYDAKRRTNEIGLRIALGAVRSDVVSLVMRQTLWMVTIGALMGLVLAVPASDLIASQLFGVRPIDLPTLVSATMLLVAVAAGAAYIPARRAAQLDPMQALRSE